MNAAKIHKTLGTGLRLAMLGLFLASTPLAAQSASAETFTQPASGPAIHGFWLSADHPDITITADKTISIPLKLLNATQAPNRSTLSVEGLPDGWNYTIKAGGAAISSAMLLPNRIDDLTLKLVPAKGAERKTYSFTAVATSEGTRSSVPLSVSLTDMPIGDTTLVPELPALHGTVKTSFQYKMKLTNGGNQDTLFNLKADLPAGFRATFKKGYGSEEITGVPVKAGASESITMEVKLNGNVRVGDYPIEVSAAGGPDEPSAKTKLNLTVSGSPELSLSGPHEMLSGEAVAGKQTTFPFMLHNIGTAPAKKIKLTATSPSGWKVIFQPESLANLEPGKVQNVNVKIEPASKAIAGDYMVTIHSAADGLSGSSESTKFRVSVETSTLWGIVGVAIIGIAVLVLIGAIFRYGRR